MNNSHIFGETGRTKCGLKISKRRMAGGFIVTVPENATCKACNPPKNLKDKADKIGKLAGESIKENVIKEMKDAKI